jgi:monovalent cation:H+ antiporter-2, CPA2 family
VHHEIALISTIAVGLVYALIGGYIANRLGLPPLVGYLLAGVAEGPFTPGFVADAKLAPQLAEIGVILLMFGVGMHFSVRDLLAVRKVAVPGALVQIASAVALTCGVAGLWGLGLGPSLVLGLALSVASTVVLLRALEAQGILGSESGQIAVGWLIVEDLITVVVLVLLPALAASLGGQPIGNNSAGAGNEGGQLLLTIGIVFAKFAGFVVFMLLVGARLLPWLLERVASTNSRELFTACCSGHSHRRWFWSGRTARTLLCSWRLLCGCCDRRIRPQSSSRGRAAAASRCFYCSFFCGDRNAL